MAIIYSIDYTDPSVDPDNKKQFTIMPGVMDLTTSLVLPGQAASLYGEHIAENFLHILENFASSTPPGNATVGQLWYDSTVRMLRILTAIATSDAGVRSDTWTVVGAPFISSTPPQITGTLWFDISNVDPSEWQLKIYNPSLGRWSSVAERYVKKSGDGITGSITTTDSHVGLTAADQTLTGFYPTTEVGPVIASSGAAAVVINTSGAGSSSFNVYSADDFTADSTVDNLLFTVSDTGEVGVVKNSLNLHLNKITNLADGVARPDGVNFGQLSDLKDIVTAAIDTKVDRSGDKMTGALTITAPGVGAGDGITPGTGLYTLIVNGTGNNAGGVLIDGGDIDNDRNGLEITNKYGPGGTTQTVFSVKSYTGDTTIAGDTSLGKTLVVAGTSAFTGSIVMKSISSMNVPVSSITDAKHLITKEYFDLMMATIPVGMVGHFASMSPPVGWLKANGALVSRTTYAGLFAAIGTTYGAGNGTTTFKLPDLRGEFVRGVDDGRAVDSGRAIGTLQLGQNLSHSHSGATSTTGSHSHSYMDTDTYYTGTSGLTGGSDFIDRNSYLSTGSAGSHSHSVSIYADGGNEARPRNVALLACIKT